MDKSYFFIKQGKFTIGGINSMSNSDSVIQLDFFQLANDSNLLDLLHLYYMNGNYGVRYTFNSRAEWFAGYISAFVRGERSKNMREYLSKNPTVKILIQDESIFIKYQEKTGKDLRVIYSS